MPRHDDEYYEDLLSTDDVDDWAKEQIDELEADEEVARLEEEDGVLNLDDYPTEDELDEI